MAMRQDEGPVMVSSWVPQPDAIVRRHGQTPCSDAMFRGYIQRLHSGAIKASDDQLYAQAEMTAVCRQSPSIVSVNSLSKRLR